MHEGSMQLRAASSSLWAWARSQSCASSTPSQPPPSPLPVALKGEGLVPGLHIFYDFISLEQVRVHHTADIPTSSICMQGRHGTDFYACWSVCCAIFSMTCNPYISDFTHGQKPSSALWRVRMPAPTHAHLHLHLTGGCTLGHGSNTALGHAVQAEGAALRACI